MLSFKAAESNSFGRFKENSPSKSPVIIKMCFISLLDKNFGRNLGLAGITLSGTYWKGKKVKEQWWLSDHKDLGVF